MIEGYAFDEPDLLDINCCDKTNCSGTCDCCGFSKCSKADDNNRCDGKGMCNMKVIEIEIHAADVDNTAEGVEDYSNAELRGQAMLASYEDALEPGEPLETVATDLVADILRAVPEDDWYTVIRGALLHAHEEIHGWGSAARLSVSIDGLAA
ncbi:hypothetical protein [Nonomuraea jabiensis]|uniref:hypothetical protein n=1 Tax=Nonomuraea jabiensis TaxID=882448 RepID=UPI003D75665C